MKPLLIEVLECIIEAQEASDEAKNGYSNREDCYKRKAYQINEVIKLLRCNYVPEVNYFISKSKDQNGYSSFITYFDIKLEEKRFQVSFHCPSDKFSFHYLVGSGRKTRWDKNIGGSRNACSYLKLMCDSVAYWS